jgi:hypothetical protein
MAKRPAYAAKREQIEEEVARMIAAWPPHIRALVYAHLYRSGLRMAAVRDTLADVFGGSV